MNKFRSELINRESSAFRKAGSRYRPELINRKSSAFRKAGSRYKPELINRESRALRKAGSRYKQELSLFGSGGYLTEVTSQEVGGYFNRDGSW